MSKTDDTLSLIFETGQVFAIRSLCQHIRKVLKSTYDVTEWTDYFRQILPKILISQIEPVLPNGGEVTQEDRAYLRSCVWQLERCGLIRLIAAEHGDWRLEPLVGFHAVFMLVNTLRDQEAEDMRKVSMEEEKEHDEAAADENDEELYAALLSDKAIGAAMAIAVCYFTTFRRPKGPTEDMAQSMLTHFHFGSNRDLFEGLNELANKGFIALATNGLVRVTRLRSKLPKLIERIRMSGRMDVGVVVTKILQEPTLYPHLREGSAGPTVADMVGYLRPMPEMFVVRGIYMLKKLEILHGDLSLSVVPRESSKPIGQVPTDELSSRAKSLIMSLFVISMTTKSGWSSPIQLGYILSYTSLPLPQVVLGLRELDEAGFVELDEGAVTWTDKSVYDETYRDFCGEGASSDSSEGWLPSLYASNLTSMPNTEHNRSILDQQLYSILQSWGRDAVMGQHNILHVMMQRYGYLPAATVLSLHRLVAIKKIRTTTSVFLYEVVQPRQEIPVKNVPDKDQTAPNPKPEAPVHHAKDPAPEPRTEKLRLVTEEEVKKKKLSETVEENIASYEVSLDQLETELLPDTVAEAEHMLRLMRLVAEARARLNQYLERRSDVLRQILENHLKQMRKGT